MQNIPKTVSLRTQSLHLSCQWPMRISPFETCCRSSQQAPPTSYTKQRRSEGPDSLVLTFPVQSPCSPPVRGEQEMVLTLTHVSVCLVIPHFKTRGVPRTQTPHTQNIYRIQCSYIVSAQQVLSRIMHGFVYTLLLNVKWETLPAAAVGREIDN